MSLTNLEEVRCPCGETFDVELVNCINASQNPELKDALMAGELNIVQCPACSKVLYADRFLLYLDMPEELIAYIHPESAREQEEELKKRMLEDFEGVQSSLGEKEKLGCAPVLIFGMDNFLRLLLYEEDQKLEMKVLEHYCKTRKDISLLKIKPSAAREMHMPAYLPVVCEGHGKNHNLRDEVLSGLKKLLEIAPGLAIYGELYTRIQGDGKWNVDRKVVRN